MKEILKAYANYLNFGGTANRREYNFFLLFCVVMTVFYCFLCSELTSDSFANKYGWSYFVIWFFLFGMPLYSIAYRRMHDANVQVEGGCLWFFIPFANLIILFNLMFATGMDYRETLFIKFIATMAGNIAADRIGLEAKKNNLLAAFYEMRLSPQKIDICREYFNKGINSDKSIFKTAEEFKSKFLEEEIRILMYRTLCFVAFGDEWITKDNLNVLRELPEHLGISKDNFFSFCNEAHIDPNSDKKQKVRFDWKSNGNQESGSPQKTNGIDAYEILGAKRTMSNEELKNAYLKKAREYHPDVLRSKGIPEGMLRFANEEMAKINSAWEDIKKERGIS